MTNIHKFTGPKFLKLHNLTREGKVIGLCFLFLIILGGNAKDFILNPFIIATPRWASINFYVSRKFKKKYILSSIERSFISIISN